MQTVVLRFYRTLYMENCHLDLRYVVWALINEDGNHGLHDPVSLGSVTLWEPMASGPGSRSSSLSHPIIEFSFAHITGRFKSYVKDSVYCSTSVV